MSIRKLSSKLDGVIGFSILSLRTAKKVLGDIRKETGVKGARAIDDSAFFITNRASQNTLEKTAAEHGIKNLEPNTAVTGIKSIDPKFAMERDTVATAVHESAHSSQPSQTILQKLNPLDIRNAHSTLLMPRSKLRRAIDRHQMQEEYRANRYAKAKIAKHGTPQEVEAWTKMAQEQIKEGYRKPLFHERLTSKILQDKNNSISGRKTKGVPMSTMKEVMRENPHLRRQQLSSKLSSIIEFGLYKRAGGATIIGKAGQSSKEISDKYMTRVVARQFPGLAEHLGKRSQQGTGAMFDKMRNAFKNTGIIYGGTVAEGAKGKRVYVNRGTLKKGFGLREIVHHEAFHNIPIIGKSEIAAHFVGGARSKKGTFDPAEGIKRIGHLHKTRPDRMGLEIGAMGAAGGIGAVAYADMRKKSPSK